MNWLASAWTFRQFDTHMIKLEEMYPLNIGILLLFPYFEKTYQQIDSGYQHLYMLL